MKAKDKHLRLLIVEDEKMLAESLKSLLNAKGFDADIANDGEEGLLYARLNIYDLMILDVMMPKKNGYGKFTVYTDTKDENFRWKYLFEDEMIKKLKATKEF